MRCRVRQRSRSTHQQVPAPAITAVIPKAAAGQPVRSAAPIASTAAAVLGVLNDPMATVPWPGLAGKTSCELVVAAIYGGRPGSSTRPVRGAGGSHVRRDLRAVA